MKIEKLFSVEGKVAVVTGGSRGIGKMIASHLVQNGCKVYIASHHTDEHENIATAEEIGCEPIVVDVTMKDSIKKLVDYVSEREDHVDILVNNAGQLAGANLEDVTEEDYDRVGNVNQKAVLFMVQQFLPLLEKSVRASVVNISSYIGGHNTTDPYPPQAMSAHYVASKAGQNKLTAMLAVELASKNITVNGIGPAAVETGMIGQHGVDYDRNMYTRKINPLGRFVEAEDLGAAVIYLSSRAGSYITGQILILDGGLGMSLNNSSDWLL